MPPVAILGILAIPLALALGGWLLFAPNDRVHDEILENATHGLDDDAAQVAAPTSRGTALIRMVTPPSTLLRMERLIARAGRPAGWPLNRALAAKVLLPLLSLGLGALFVSDGASFGRYALVGVVTVVCHFVPDLLLLSKSQERQSEIALALPDTLDQMTIGVEAGLGFEAAMMRTARNGTGALAEEMMRTLTDMQLGNSRRTAYVAFAERVAVPDLRRFLRAVIQADAYGVAIADVLRTQAQEMRLKRRQSAEEKAMKIPVKVIFPLMLCILPALFVVLLGPAVIDMVKAFS